MSELAGRLSSVRRWRLDTLNQSHGEYAETQGKWARNLEGGAAVRPGTVWSRFEPQQLPELPAPIRICLQAPQEALGQGQSA